jgi:threonine/homoserine/homoserine lactone efflux protein
MTMSFLITTLIVVVTPGPGVVQTLAAGISRGARASVVAAVGCTAGVLPHLALSITGLAALLRASPVVFQTVKYLGVAYLVYMAISALRERGGLELPESGAQVRSYSDLRVVRDSVLVNLLNPKLTVFFVALFPQFLNPAAPGYLTDALLLGSVFTLTTLAVFVAYGVFAASVRAQIIARPRILGMLRRVFAVSFLALGLKIAFDG